MKKKFLSLLSISLITILLISLAQAEEVELTSASGDVEVLLSGENDYTPA